ncbi:MAG: rhodanese-like domain-containing protein [Ghiorsea sp.]
MEWIQNNIGTVLIGLFAAWIIWTRVVKPKMVGVKSMSANEYEAFKDTAHTLLDVRTSGEWNNGHAAEAVHIPLNELGQRMDEVAKDKAVVVICASGMRSMAAASGLGSAGYAPVYNYSGGMGCWQGKVK